MDETAAQKPQPNGEQLTKLGAKCMERINAAGKREDKWRKDAENAEKAYSANAESKAGGKVYDFNILHSNVETIVPAIYNSTPVPDVRRRFVEATGEPPQPPQEPQPQQGPDGQPIPPTPEQQAQFQQQAQQAQAAMQQFAAKQQMDTDAKNYGDMIERCIGVMIDDNRLDSEIESQAQDSFLAGRGIIRLKYDADTSGDAPRNERIAFEAVSWRDYREGPAKRFEDLPWMAFRHTMAREAYDEFEDGEMAASQVVDGERPLDDNDDDIHVWEYWDKAKREVKFIREHDNKVIKVVPDPLKLKGFFPIPPTVQPIGLTGSRMPVCPFTIYKKLADELDLITKRINKIMSGVKVAGAVAGDAKAILDLSSLADNELTVLDGLEGLAQNGGIPNAVMWWPIEQAIAALQQLYMQRNEVKAAIYEITGISDIVRGASNAQETARAQEIKTQWGSLRIQKMQRLIQRQVRDVFCMMAEMLTNPDLFSEETLQQMSGIQITDGMRQLMSQPVFASYRVDVESDSTVKADLTRVKGEMTEFLQGTGAFFGVVGPLIKEQPEFAAPMSEVYASFARIFKLGKSAEDALDQMTQMAKKVATQPKPSPEQEAMAAEMEMKKAEMEMKSQETQANIAAKQQEAQIKAQSEDRKAALDLQKSQTDLQIKQIDLQIKQEELGIRREESAIRIGEKQAMSAIKTEQAMAKAQEPPAQPQ